MSVNPRKVRKVVPGRLQQSSVLASEPAIFGDSFQATLSHCVQANRDQKIPTDSITAARRVEKIQWQGVCSDLLTRTWSFLQTKYKTSTTKRLHVSETISLGEKRFVAIVAVEGREFLIGGGVSGMSLLAQLGSGAGTAGDFGQKIGGGGGVV
jgi:hypothetical protein